MSNRNKQEAARIPFIQVLEPRQLLSASPLQFDASPRADSLAAVSFQPLRRALPSFNNFVGTYTGRMRITRLTGGADGRVGSRIDTRLDINNATLNGLLTGTFNLNGRGTYNASGVLDGRRVNFVLTGGPGSGTLNGTFGRTGRVFVGRFFERIGGQTTRGTLRLVLQDQPAAAVGQTRFVGSINSGLDAGPGSAPGVGIGMGNPVAGIGLTPVGVMGGLAVAPLAGTGTLTPGVFNSGTTIDFGAI